MPRRTCKNCWCYTDAPSYCSQQCMDEYESKYRYEPPHDNLLDRLQRSLLKELAAKGRKVYRTKTNKIMYCINGGKK